jgi:solute carrier family 25 protein 16
MLLFLSQYFSRLFGPTPKVQHADKFFAGAGAGLTAVLLTYPLDTIRARLAFQVTGEHRYTGILHTATTIIQKEGGVRALYRGFVPTLMGMAPYAGLSFYCFEVIKYACMKYIPNYTCNNLERNTGA